jgi:hypothetical protein
MAVIRVQTLIDCASGQERPIFRVGRLCDEFCFIKFAGAVTMRTD